MLLTPPGAAAIAVVRLAGLGVAAFLAEHFDKPAAPGRCVHGLLRDGARVIDDAVVVTSPDGAVADLNIHGGPWVVRATLELAGRWFEVISTAPPLPPEAVDADDVIEREVLQYLPLARTELALRALLAQVEAWKAIGRSPPDVRGLEMMLNDRSLQWLLHPPRVALVGLPNAGKSTLANRLFAQERSITADGPGTTRDWVGETANLDGLAITLLDTPGLRESSDPIEREAIGGARGEVATAELVVLVLDPTQDSVEQSRLEADFPSALRVMNKADCAGGTVGRQPTLRTVATTGEGVERVRDAVRAHFLGPGPYRVDQVRWWTPRQRRLLEAAVLDPRVLSA